MSRPDTMAQAIEQANQEAHGVHWYSSNCGRVNLALTLEDAQSGAHSGRCDEDIAELRRVPYVAEQLAAVPEATAREIAAETGRNDYGHGPEDMADHDANLSWLLWQACWDIVEGDAE